MARFEIGCVFESIDVLDEKWDKWFHLDLRWFDLQERFDLVLGWFDLVLEVLVLRLPFGLNLIVLMSVSELVSKSALILNVLSGPLA